MPMPALPPDLTRLSLADIEAGIAAKHLPPVETWNPPHCGHSGIRIARDGTWLHNGDPITRETMIRLFSTILRREADGSYVLVTPSEKLTIDVEDVPFVAVEVKCDGARQARTLAFRLNTGDVVIAGKSNALRAEERPDGPRIYLHVRGGMDAVIARPVYYELAEAALDENADPPGLWSGGIFHPMVKAN